MQREETAYDVNRVVRLYDFPQAPVSGIRDRGFFVRGLSTALRLPIRPHARAFSLRSIRHAALPRFVSAIPSRPCATKAHKVDDVLQHLYDKGSQGL